MPLWMYSTCAMSSADLIYVSKMNIGMDSGINCKIRYMKKNIYIKIFSSAERYAILAIWFISIGQ